MYVANYCGGNFLTSPFGEGRAASHAFHAIGHRGHVMARLVSQGRKPHQRDDGKLFPRLEHCKIQRKSL
jgi:hypothetical protein